MAIVHGRFATVAELGAEGVERRGKFVAIMQEIDALMDRLEAKAA